MPITEYGDGAVPSDFETFDVIPDSIYGSGMDGNVTISTNTTLARDMYYNNLTINPGIVLDTAGYRVFVRNNLAMAATSTNQGDTKIGRVGGVSTTGTLKGGGQAAVIDSLGGNGNGYTATAPTEGADYFNHPDIAVDGVIQHGGSTTPTALDGGAGSHLIKLTFDGIFLQILINSIMSFSLSLIPSKTIYSKVIILFLIFIQYLKESIKSSIKILFEKGIKNSLTD